MKNAHARLVDKGLNDTHVDAVVDHLGGTLKELGVSDDLVGEVAGVAESVRDQVLGREG
jgi:hemoglobin